MLLRALQNTHGGSETFLLVDDSFKLAIIMSQEHISLLNNCNEKTGRFYREACHLWMNGKLFDNVIAMDKMAPYKANESPTLLNHNSSYHWPKKLSSYLDAPCKVTLFLDSEMRKLVPGLKLYSSWLTISLATCIGNYYP
jgi:hypothetical protein